MNKEQSVLLTRSNVLAVSENGEHSWYVVDRPECRCCCCCNNDPNLAREYAGISVGDGIPRSSEKNNKSGITATKPGFYINNILVIG